MNPEEDDDLKYGFRRPEMYRNPLAGTVDAYDRHVFICYKSPNHWPPSIEEDPQLHSLPSLLASALKSRKDQISGKVRLTLCEGENGNESCNGDILIFPDMIRYRGLTNLDVDAFIEDVLVRSSKFAQRVPESLTGSYVFVCCHQNRDKRCGQCGPILVEKLIEEIEMRHLKNEVFVSPCSHLGGHQYAGNLIIFGPGREGKSEGHWYGYVTPNDVPCLLDEHIVKGKIVERLWRGQMSSSEVKKMEEQRPQDNNNKGNASGALCWCTNDPSNCCGNKTKEQQNKADPNSSKAAIATKGFGRL